MSRRDDDRDFIYLLLKMALGYLVGSLLGLILAVKLFDWFYPI